MVIKLAKKKMSQWMAEIAIILQKNMEIIIIIIYIQKIYH